MKNAELVISAIIPGKTYFVELEINSAEFAKFLASEIEKIEHFSAEEMFCLL